MRGRAGASGTALSLGLTINPSINHAINQFAPPGPRPPPRLCRPRRATRAARGGRPISTQPAPGGGQSAGGKNAGWTRQRGGEWRREEAGWQGTLGVVVLLAPSRAGPGRAVPARGRAEPAAPRGPHGGGSGAHGRAGAGVSALPRLYRRPEAAGRRNQGGPGEGFPGERRPRPHSRRGAGRGCPPGRTRSLGGPRAPLRAPGAGRGERAWRPGEPPRSSR